jgi:spermidine dehydrogenase
MSKSDRQLGMSRNITRRDFIHGTGLVALTLGLPSGVAGGQPSPAPAETAGRYYPPTLTGLRGSHPGSFEVAHELALESKHFDSGEDLGEEYDLVVVGGGISGLAAAYFYRQRFGKDSRILILENHEDFGGHATRNEFHQGGPMRLVWGGDFNLEYSAFSERGNALLSELGVDIGRLLEHNDFNYGDDGELGSAIYFDAETYGRDVLIPGFTPRWGDFASILEKIDAVPLSQKSRDSLKRFYSVRTDVLEGRSPEERQQFLRQISYIDFIRQYGGLTGRRVRGRRAADGTSARRRARHIGQRGRRGGPLSRRYRLPCQIAGPCPDSSGCRWPGHGRHRDRGVRLFKTRSA